MRRAGGPPPCWKKRAAVAETPGAFHAHRYHNPANPEAHYVSTAPEIWEQTAGEIDVFCAGMGTGGTISGCGRYFKEKKPGFQVIGVDPIGSLYYDYVKTGRLTKPFAGPSADRTGHRRDRAGLVSPGWNWAACSWNFPD